MTMAMNAARLTPESPARLDLPVIGMTCAACAARVRRALVTLPHVTAVEVNPTTDSATLLIDPGHPTPPLATIQARLTAAGYGLALTDHRLTLLHLSGQIEAERAASIITGLPGCLSVTINAATGLLQARFTASGTDRATIDAHLDHAGFHRAPQNEAATPSSFSPPPALIALLLTFPLLVPMLLAPFGIIVTLPTPLIFLLGAPVQVILARPFYRAAFMALRQRVGTMDHLIILGTSAAWALSLWNIATVAPETAPDLYIEPAAAIITFVLIGKALEQRAKHRTGAALGALNALMPRMARIVRDGQEQTIPTDLLTLDTVILVKPGERIPADGRIVAGIAQLDEQVVTGESVPATRTIGDLVAAGTLDLDGPLSIIVTALGPASSLGRIITQVEIGQSTKAQAQRLADRVCAVFVPAILVIALFTFAGWLLAGAALDTALVRSVAVLVIACPCALGLATPAALVVAVGRAARNGLLIKAAATLETAQRIDLVAFDKTGTLTQGHPILVRYDACSSQSAQSADLLHPARDGVSMTPGSHATLLNERKKEILGDPTKNHLALAARMQVGHDHPLARALKQAASNLLEHDGVSMTSGSHATLSNESKREILGDPTKNHLALAPVSPETSPQAVPSRALAGLGIEAMVDGVPYALGSEKLLTRYGLTPTPLAVEHAAAEAAGHSVAFLMRLAHAAEPARLLALFAFTDPLRPGAAEAVRRLQDAGVTVALLTGDTAGSAARVAAACGITEVAARLSPTDKAEHIRVWRSQGRRVAMVGDGINDAPALATADLGIAISTGTDIAIAAADATILGGDPARVVSLLSLAHRTQWVIRENLAWAFLFNGLGIPAAAFGLLDPMLAAAAMAASSIAVISNALRLASVP